MATHCAIVSFFLSIIAIFPFFLNGVVGLGFSTDLIHIDSPSSPFRNSSLSHSEILKNNIIRSHNRMDRFNAIYSQKNSISSVLYGSIPGNYYMEFTIGTPPITITGIADTGSNYIWTQCQPCKNCFHQDKPIFNPKSSSTYKIYSCRNATGLCNYGATYADGSFSNGILATDTLSLHSAGRKQAFFPNIIFGCGFNNSGISLNEHVSGFVGLGTGPISLISQLNSSINGKLSYCLVPFGEIGTPSRLNFGDNAEILGPGVLTTTLFLKTNYAVYFLSLEGMTIGNQRLEYFDSFSNLNSEPQKQSGNIIIDSGTTLTYLPEDYFNRLKLAAMKEIKTTPVADPHKFLSLCYKMSDNPSFPNIIAHFTGADLLLSPINSFVLWDANLLCWAFAPSPTLLKTNNLAIFGNIAQADFLIGYDINKRTVSFKRTNCGGH